MALWLPLYCTWCSCPEPQLHVICTSIGCYLGYLAHRYEETSEERVERLLERHNAPVASSYMNMSEAPPTAEQGVGYCAVELACLVRALLCMSFLSLYLSLRWQKAGK